MWQRRMAYDTAHSHQAQDIPAPLQPDPADVNVAHQPQADPMQAPLQPADVDIEVQPPQDDLPLQVYPVPAGPLKGFRLFSDDEDPVQTSTSRGVLLIPHQVAEAAVQGMAPGHRERLCNLMRDVGVAVQADDGRVLPFGADASAPVCAQRAS